MDTWVVLLTHQATREWMAFVPYRDINIVPRLTRCQNLTVRGLRVPIGHVDDGYGL
jgi:hypothetical protein